MSGQITSGRQRKKTQRKSKRNLDNAAAVTHVEAGWTSRGRKRLLVALSDDEDCNEPDNADTLLNDVRSNMEDHTEIDSYPDIGDEPFNEEMTDEPSGAKSAKVHG